MAELSDNRGESLKREALSWLTRFSSGEVTDDDRAALRRWRDTSPAHRAALAEVAQLWRGLEGPVAELVSRGRASVPLLRQPVPLLSRRAVLAGGATATAAAVSLLVVRPPLELWPSLAELSADHRTATGEQQHLTLAEAVTVDLNTRTSIAVRNTEQDADMELVAGEAAVTVGKDAARPFVVRAGGGSMQASAATFNVRRTGADVRLTCIAGEVAVACGGHTLVLKAEQQVSYDEAGFGDVMTVDAGIETAWRDGMLVFRNTPLSRVIEEVNRYRAGRIILLDTSLGRRSVTARFEIQRLDTVMGQIANTFKVPVRSLPGGLVLVG